jgi:hypothetical protein
MLTTGAIIAIPVHAVGQVKSVFVAPIQKRLRDRRASAATADTRRDSNGSELAREGQRDEQPANQRPPIASIVYRMCSSWQTLVAVMAAALVGVSLVSAYIP